MSENWGNWWLQRRCGRGVGGEAAMTLQNRGLAAVVGVRLCLHPPPSIGEAKQSTIGAFGGTDAPQAVTQARVGTSVASKQIGAGAAVAQGLSIFRWRRSAAPRVQRHHYSGSQGVPNNIRWREANSCGLQLQRLSINPAVSRDTQGLGPRHPSIQSTSQHESVWTPSAEAV